MIEFQEHTKEIDLQYDRSKKILSIISYPRIKCYRLTKTRLIEVSF